METHGIFFRIDMISMFVPDKPPNSNPFLFPNTFFSPGQDYQTRQQWELSDAANAGRPVHAAPTTMQVHQGPTVAHAVQVQVASTARPPAQRCGQIKPTKPRGNLHHQVIVIVIVISGIAIISNGIEGIDTSRSSSSCGIEG